jgi:hypothetical protein
VEAFREPAAPRRAGPVATGPRFLVTGGDRALLASVRSHLDKGVADLPTLVHLGIGTPDADVLARIPDEVLAVRIDLVEP